MTELSKEHLFKVLTDSSAYKQTKSYIEQIMACNENIYAAVSEALVAIMKSNKVSMVGKLQAMRFFKDIFETGNFQCIDSLDQEIEDHIVEVVQYNKGSKDVMTRGSDYFTEIEKRKATKESKQMGISYILLATEMIKNFAIWYPYDEDKE